MAKTRAQDKATAVKSPTPAAKSETKKRPHSKIEKSNATSKKRAPKKAKKAAEKPGASSESEGNAEEKISRQSSTTASGSNSKVQSLIQKYGSIPLSDTDLADPSSPKPETILALVMHAMLSSARISHDLAAKATRTVIGAKYNQLNVLKSSSWQERTVVLTEGGYTRYREKTATAFGELAELLVEKHDGDLNNILQSTGKSPTKIRETLKEIKGIGNVGVDIFFSAAQGVWPCLAPFLDPRSVKTAKTIGIGGDVDTLWKQVGQDPMSMCKLASALARVRLDKREGEFQ